MAFAGRRVLVTGGAGFIGSNLAHRLVALGAEVRVLDSFEPDSGANPFNLHGIEDRVRVDRVDLRDPLDPAVVADADVIFNLAGLASHVDSMRDPRRDLAVNAGGMLNLLEAVRASGAAPRIVYTGTRSQYGRIVRTPVDETHPLTPTDANGVSKSAGESYHLMYARTYGVRATSLRLTNTYGPRHLMRTSRQGVLGWFVRQAVDGETIRLFGGGRQERDVLHVDDVVDALLAAADRESLVGNAYNVGSGRGTSLRAYVETLIGVAGTGRFEDVPFDAGYREVEIGDYVADASRFRKETGWEPRTPLEDGLRATVEYYRRHRARYWG